MAVTLKLEPLDRDIAFIADQTLSPAAQAKALKDFADEALADAEATNLTALGYVTPHDTFVDGVPSGPAYTVRPDSVIIFAFHLAEDLFTFIHWLLVAKSPVRTGRFRQSHVLLADGEEVDPEGEIPIAGEYAFVNTQPYARKIERGLSKQAPEGVYEVVASMARARYSNVAQIKFSYRSLGAVSAIHTWAQKKIGALRRAGKRVKPGREDWFTRQPAIVITLR